VGLFFTYISPAYDTLQAFRAQVVQLDTALQNSQDLKQQREEKITQMNELPRADVARLMKILPDTLDPVRVIVDLDGLAYQTGVTLDSFDIPDLVYKPTAAGSQAQNASSTNELEQAQFTVLCIGQYDSVKQFLRGMETSLGLLDVTSIAIDTKLDSRSAQKNTLPPGQVAATVVFQAYWLK
jgi:Tfp pilus assembly protein PilO